MKTMFAERVCRSIIRRSSALSVLLLSMLMTLSTSQALAQDEPLRPPTTQEPPSGPKFIVLGVALLLAGLVIVVATLKSKRGHQD
ncbi:MAG: hypothetical protein CMJ35_00880 [Phycisphaerae bacterium]|nr:hypothetical protein [Phycisphaerae bacterium]HCT46509.1 hypothetical protein [Phycisphaerales bacterium]|tara:strand:+ start:108 stop:362 length:255 start_codon:yes stop_codon:yes gene_type:complete